MLIASFFMRTSSTTMYFRLFESDVSTAHLIGLLDATSAIQCHISASEKLTIMHPINAQPPHPGG